MRRKSWLALPLLLAATVVGAEESGAETTAPEPVRSVVQALLGGQAADAIRPAMLPGVYEVTDGYRLFYISADGRYLLKGDVYDLASGANLTDRRLGELRRTALDGLDADSAISYTPQGETKHTITVFTDVDCGYCRKLHRGMDEMNELGIAVRYLAFPRAGVGSESYDKMVSAWCADDRQAALTAIKAGESIPAKQCENPIDQHLDLVRAFGLTGTPAIVLEDGQLIPGYVPPQKLLAILDERSE